MQHGVIVGCGFMGKCHGEAYRTMENVRIIAVIDMDQERGEALARRMDCSWFPSLDALQQKKVDFVDICLPTHLHLAAIRQASNITRNIICEKPLAVSEDEVKEINRLVSEKGLHLMVAHVLRFWESYVKTAEMVQHQILGQITSVSCSRRQKRPNWSGKNWLSNVSLSGGLIFDLMIHDIDYVVWLFGKPQAVLGQIVYGEDNAPLHAKAQLQYNHFTADLFASWGMPASFQLVSRLEVIGDRGMTAWDSGTVFTWRDHEKVQEMSLANRNPYEEELAYFVSCCEQNICPSRSDVKSVLDSLEVARAIDRSAHMRSLLWLDENI